MSDKRAACKAEGALLQGLLLMGSLALNVGQQEGQRANKTSNSANFRSEKENKPLKHQDHSDT